MHVVCLTGQRCCCLCRRPIGYVASTFSIYVGSGEYVCIYGVLWGENWNTRKISYCYHPDLPSRSAMCVLCVYFSQGEVRVILASAPVHGLWD